MLMKKKPEVYYIAAESGFVSFESGTGRLYYSSSFLQAEPYFSMQQAIVAVENMKLKVYAILRETEQIPRRLL